MEICGLPSDKIFLVFCFLQEFLLYFSIFRKAAAAAGWLPAAGEMVFVDQTGGGAAKQKGPKVPGKEKICAEAAA